MSDILKKYIRQIVENQKSNISIDSVKFENMPSKSWYASPHHSLWYYHSPVKNPIDINLNTLSQTLDPCMKTAVEMLNKKGYPTLPSCQGHYHSKERLDLAYDNLVKDAFIIRNSGLELKNVEDGSSFLFKNSKWNIPWSRKEYYSVASGEGGIPEGYLGFLSKNRNLSKVIFPIIKSKISGSRCYTDVKFNKTANIIRIYTGEKKSQCEAWLMLNSIIKNIPENR